MERKICFDGAAVISACGGRAHRRKETVELLERRGIDANRRMACRESLEHGTDRVKLNQFLDGNLADDRASKRGADDEPEQVEVAQGFPDRRLADAELLGDTHLHNTLTRRQFAVQDLFDQLVPNLIAQDTPFAPRGFFLYHFDDPLAGNANAT